MTWQEFIQKCTAFPPGAEMVVDVVGQSTTLGVKITDVDYDGQRIVITAEET